MMKQLARAAACLTTGALLLSGCSMLTTQGRQERAYSRYVHKMSAGRVKQQKRFASKGNRMPITPMSEPTVSSEGSGPESFSDGSNMNGEGGGQ